MYNVCVCVQCVCVCVCVCVCTMCVCVCVCVCVCTMCVCVQCVCVYLLDITKQQCCIEWFVSCLYNYIHFPEIITPTDKALLQARITVGSSLWDILVAVPRQEQHSPLQGSCCPVWAQCVCV